ALCHQPAAEASAGKNKPSSRLHKDVAAQVAIRKTPVAVKRDSLDFPASPSLDFVHDCGAIGILFQAAPDLDIEEPLGLKVRGQVLLSLLNKIGIHCIFLINGNLSPLRAA